MSEGSRDGRARKRSRGWFQGAAVLAALALVLLRAERAQAQADLRDITQPIAVVNSGGHSAPVRSLIFAAPDGSQILSAGLDKVVHVWSLGDPRPRLVQTIRPRLWRGYAGAIYAMALAPRVDAGGQRLLAVAGIGVESHRGEINLFRFPGLEHVATGEIDAQLPGGAPRGHGMSVMCLAFDPSGRFLASGSNDRTVRVWNVPARTTAAVLSGHTGPVNALGYAPDGLRLVTGGGDGLLNVWDVARRALVATARPNPRRQRPNDPAGDAINALAVSADGRWVVAGRENGDLLRYNLADLRGETLLPRGGAGQGAVEALALSSDGTKLVTSVVSHGLTRPSDVPDVACDVELRSMPEGTVQTRLARASNLVHACSFSPDNARVAFAGGDTQAITVRDLADLNRPPLELAGQGSSVWDVGFGQDGRTLGFSRTRSDLAGAAEAYEDFDLQGRRVAPFARGELARARTTLDGWTVRPVDPYTLDLLDAQGRGFRLKLDPGFDRRWWAYSFIPASATHPRPTLAVACEAGVVFFRLSDGARTRVYAGHNGPVYALAPSPDGVWLATGSVDQTVRLWSLAGCDTLAPLGARLAPAPGRLATVAAVERRSFAEAMDLRAGDLVQEIYINGQRTSDPRALDPVAPNTKIELAVLRGGSRVELITTKRNPPALTLFPALDREWVVWSPRGYYDTSAIGDRRYLGWHRNRAAATQPTDYFAFDHFEKELRRPQELERLLRTGDPAAFDPPPGAGGVAAREPERIVAEDRLPRLDVLVPARPPFGPLVAAGPGVPVRVRAESEDGRADRGLIRSIRVLVDSGKVAELVFNPPVPSVDRVVPVRVNPGPHTVSVIAVNDLAKERAEVFEVVAPEPPAPAPAPEPAAPEPPRLVVLAIGAGEFPGDDSRWPRIPFAAEDARDVGAFLAAPGGSPRYRRVEVRSLVGPEATMERILAAFKRLDDERARGELGQGDAVFVLVESHFLAFGPHAVILGTDVADSAATPPAPSVPAAALVETLGRLADYGCTVLVLLDTLHDRRPSPPQTNRGLNEWTRALYRSNVITLVASIHGPGLPVASRGHRAFALGILDSLNVQGRSRLSGGPADRPLTLYEFQDRITRNVEALTNRQQHARGYIPEAIPSQIAILDPQPRSQPRALGVARP